MTKAEFTRLPASVVPSNYKIHLTPNLKEFTFKGVCEVQVSVKEAIQSIVCNAKNLEIQSAVVMKGESGEEITGQPEVNDEKEELTVKLEKTVEAGPAVIKYVFTGILNDKMRGFYRAKYMVDGQERYAASTQFESTDARQAFPCWDEPAVKATFDIVVTGPRDRVILSNMPVLTDVACTDAADMRTVTFDTTPVMSSYLVAIVVGEFDYVESATPEGIQVRVYTPLGKKEQGEFALDCGVRALTFYQTFFKVPYPLKKYDMIAIPDFEMGAMENWGLVTYRESCILYDPKNSSTSSKEYVAVVVCHEAAHQWFGNLVTMEWWTHLWLNEGFASFMENLTTDSLYPEFKIFETFVNNTMINALKLDALDSSHPIEVEVGHPDEVNEIFDSISYEKGCSVIRMLYNWIGADKFKAGMHSYLTKYAYQNTHTPQLWAELEEASGMPVGKVMTTWTKQMGFPVITATSKQDGADRLVKLEQAKFVSSMGSESKAADCSLWSVPVSIITEGTSGNSEKTTKLILDQQCMEVRLANVDPGHWIKLNPDFSCFYRVRYSPEDLDRLIQAIKNNAITSPLDRLNILNDFFSLISAGRANTIDGLRLLQAFKNEESYVVWNSINSAVTDLNTLLADDSYYCDFQRFVLDLFSVIKTKVSWEVVEGEDHFTTLLRTIVLTRLGKFGDEEVRAEAKRRFDQHVAGTTLIKPDLRTTVYMCTAAAGRTADFESMLALYAKETLQEEMDRMQRAGLAAAGSPELLKRALTFAVSEQVRPQDCCHMIACVARNNAAGGRDLCWNFLTEHFDELKERHTGYLLNYLIKSITEKFLTLDKAAMVEKYFEEHPVPSAKRGLSQALETVRVNAAWHERDGEQLEAFFANF